MRAGEIYRHDRFYRDAATAELKRKYLIFLAPMVGGDWVARLLTSQLAMRSEQPPCDHGDPYPGFFLGVPGPPLTLKTWVDLRALGDVDTNDVRMLVARGTMGCVLQLRAESLVSVLECTAGAPDTTVRQERALRDQIARLR